MDKERILEEIRICQKHIKQIQLELDELIEKYNEQDSE